MRPSSFALGRLYAVITALLYQSWGTLAVECYAPPGLTPFPMHCQNVLNALAMSALIPGANDPILYGRRQNTTATTSNIPRLWQIEDTHTPNTCGVLVNSREEDPLAEEKMRLLDVVIGGQLVLNQCLLVDGLVGREFPGPQGKLYASLVRAITVSRTGVGHGHVVMLNESVGLRVIDVPPTVSATIVQ